MSKAVGPLSRLLGVALCLLVSSGAEASPLFELMGAGVGTGGLNARAGGASAASTYFNPALLPRARQGLNLGWYLLNDAVSITLDPRYSANDVPLSSLNRVRTDTPPVPTDWLQNGCVAGGGTCVRNVAAQPRQSQGSSGSVRAYQLLGLVNHLLDDYLTLGFYALVPLTSFTQANSFFVDEREQFVSNSLHPELYADRLTPVSLAFGAGSRLTDWLSLGLSFTLGLSNQADAVAYVGNSGKLSDTLELSTKVNVAASVAPHMAAVLTPFEDLDFSLTVHSPQKMEIETAFRIYLPNGDIQRAARTATHSWLPWIVGLGTNYTVARSQQNKWDLTGTLTFERWSQYLNRQSERPLKNYEWSDIFAGALGVRLTHEERLSTFLDANFRPSPVPMQSGRTNYVDNDRFGLSGGADYELPFPSWKVVLRFGAQAQVHMLRERHQTKINPRAPQYAGRSYSQLVADEWPDDSVDVSTGQPIAEAAGLQTNNPGWPGFASSGFILGAGATVSLLY